MLKPLPTIAELWESYSDVVILDGTNPNLIQDMKRTFYAGAWAQFCSIETLGKFMSQERWERGRGLRELKRYKQELQAFHRRIGAN